MMEIKICTDMRLIKLSENLRGWYFDTTGVLCCMINEILFTIFVNDLDDVVEIAADKLTATGFDMNLEWDTLDMNNPVAATNKFIKMCILRHSH